MYARIENEQIVLKQRPNWFGEDGQKVSDELLKEKGYYVVVDSDHNRYDILQDTQDWSIDEESKTITKTYIADPKALEKHKVYSIQKAKEIAENKLYNSVIDFGGVPLKTNKDAYTNFHELASLASNQKYDNDIKKGVKKFMKGLDLTAEQITEISRLYGLHKLTTLNDAEDVIADIEQATTIEAIDIIIGRYENEV